MKLQQAVNEFQKLCLERDPSCQFQITQEPCINMETGENYMDHSITVYHSEGVDKYAVYENSEGIAGGVMYV